MKANAPRKSGTTRPANTPAAAHSTAATRSPSSPPLDGNPAVATQFRLAESLNRGPRVAQLRALQARLNPGSVAQRQEDDEETGAIQMTGGTAGQTTQSATSPQPNRTGLPDRLKAGVETLSGLSMDDVRVHYNSSRPAQLQALAYTQGSDIHVGPGQERHLAHEAWHVVQQKQGRVRPTVQLRGVGVNDDGGLEREADWMGERALQLVGKQNTGPDPTGFANETSTIIQRKILTLGEMDDEPNPITLENLLEIIEGALSANDTNRLENMSKDDEEHIFSLNQNKRITLQEAQGVIDAWPTSTSHAITEDIDTKKIIEIKNALKTDENSSHAFIPAESLRLKSVETIKKIDGIPTTNDVKTRTKKGYGKLVEHILAKQRYNGIVNKNNASLIKEWALSTAYLNMGIPVWENNMESVRQLRRDLGPHKLLESHKEVNEENQKKTLREKPPGTYAFVVPLSFPFKKKIMIGPEPDVNTGLQPTRSEGHSALSTKDERKKNESNLITLAKGVLFAGSVTIGEDGAVLNWSNDSGHYRVSRKNDENDKAGILTERALSEMGFPFPMDKYKDIE